MSGLVPDSVEKKGLMATQAGSRNSLPLAPVVLNNEALRSHYTVKMRQK